MSQKTNHKQKKKNMTKPPGIKKWKKKSREMLMFFLCISLLKDNSGSIALNTSRNYPKPFAEQTITDSETVI